MILTFRAPDELGATTGDGGRFGGPEAPARVVGVVRGVRDAAAKTGETNLLLDESYVLGGPGLSDATTEAAGFSVVHVTARGGDVSSARAAIESAFAGRPFNMAPAYGPDQIDPVDEAIDYEVNGVLAFAALAALAGAVFTGQAIARHARREWTDVAALVAIGLGRR
ncbi:MAG: hypothetical protein ACRD0A_00265, partial [Acidimicrobiales bacterium]